MESSCSGRIRRLLLMLLLSWWRRAWPRSGTTARTRRFRRPRRLLRMLRRGSMERGMLTMSGRSPGRWRMQEAWWTSSRASLSLIPDMVHVTLMMSGVRSPGTRLGPEGRPDPAQCEPFATEAHYFTESRLLQREIEVILESHNNNNFVGSVIHPAGNIAEALLKEGMAKC